jgi:hypothetical protein
VQQHHNRPRTSPAFSGQPSTPAVNDQGVAYRHRLIIANLVSPGQSTPLDCNPADRPLTDPLAADELGSGLAGVATDES